MSKYGAFKYGTKLYAEDDLASYMHGYEWAEEPGTRYVGRSNGDTSASSFADFNADRSGMALAFSTVSGHPQISTLAFENDDQRTVAAIIAATTSTSGTIFSLAAPNKLRLRLNAGSVEVMVDGTTISTLTTALPDVSATSQRYLVAWTQEKNPDTTGASDATTHRLTLRNLDTDSVEVVEVDGSVATVSGSARTASLWGDAGSDIFGGIAEALVLSERPWSGAELEVALLSPPDAPSVTATDTELPLVPDRDSGIVEPAELVGPVESMVAAAQTPLSLRAVGPALNLRYRDPPTISSTSSPAAWWKTAPGTNTTGAKMFLGWFHYLPIPDECNRVLVRARIERVAGSAGTPTIRATLMNRRPTVAQLVDPNDKPPPLEVSWAETSAPTADGTETLTLGPLVVRKDNDDTGTYFALALDLPASTSIKLHALAAIPVQVVNDGEGLGGITLP